MKRNANGGSNGNIFSRRAHPIVNMKLFNLPSSYKVATPQSNSSKKISTQRLNQYRQKIAAASAFDIFEPQMPPVLDEEDDALNF
jgi:hypothetical protein